MYCSIMAAEAPGDEALAAAARIVQARVEQLGWADVEVRAFPPDRIELRAPAEIEEGADLQAVVAAMREVIETRGELSLRLLVQRDPAELGKYEAARAHLAAHGPGAAEAGGEWLPIEDPLRFFGLRPADEELLAQVDLTSRAVQVVVARFGQTYFALAETDSDQMLGAGAGLVEKLVQDAQTEINEHTGERVVLLTLTPGAGEALYRLTQANLRRHLAIVIDGTIRTDAVIMSAVRDKVQISGRFDEAQAQRLAAILDSGSLPATLTLMRWSMKGARGEQTAETNR